MATLLVRGVDTDFYQLQKPKIPIHTERSQYETKVLVGAGK